MTDTDPDVVEAARMIRAYRTTAITHFTDDERAAYRGAAERLATAVLGPLDRRQASSDRRQGPRRKEEVALHYAREALVVAAEEWRDLIGDRAGLVDAVDRYTAAARAVHGPVPGGRCRSVGNLGTRCELPVDHAQPHSGAGTHWYGPGFSQAADDG